MLNTHTSHVVRRLPTENNAALLTQLTEITRFLPRGELLAVRYGLTTEEHAFFIDKVAELATTLKTMPKSFDTEDMGDEAIVHLHYFKAGSDWYITELDSMGDGRVQAFGYAVLNGDVQNAELGYINIEALVVHGAELDLYWSKRTLDLVKEAVAA